MPVYEGDEGALIVDPQGDILFTTSNEPHPEDGRIELVLANPGRTMTPGELEPEFAGQTTADIGAVVRIRLDMKRAVVLQEALTTVMLQLQGFPLRGAHPQQG